MASVKARKQLATTLKEACDAAHAFRDGVAKKLDADRLTWIRMSGRRERRERRTLERIAKLDDAVRVMRAALSDLQR